MITTTIPRYGGTACRRFSRLCAAGAESRCESSGGAMDRSVGRNGPGAGPFPDGADVFGAGHTEGLRRAQLCDQDVGRELLPGGEGGVEGGGNGLLDFGAGETLARGRQPRQVEALWVALAFFQVQSEEIAANRRGRQIHEEDFVETAFAQHFGRQRGDVVGSGGEKNAGFAILHPGQQRRKQTPRETCVGIAAAAGGSESFFDFVDPQNQRSYFLRKVESPAKASFGFSDELVVKSAGIEAGQLESPLAGNGARGEALAAALHAGDENSLGRHQPEALTFGREGAFSLADPVAQTAEAGDVRERGVAPDSFKQALAAQQFPLGFQDGIKECRIRPAQFEGAATQGAHGFGEGQSGQTARQFF